MTVVYVAPDEAIHLRGALGPLQSMGVDGSMSLSLKPADRGTDLVFDYVVFGYAKDGLHGMAGSVDAVLMEQLERLRMATVGESKPAAGPL